jgi:hypothetical protein
VGRHRATGPCMRGHCKLLQIEDGGVALCDIGIPCQRLLWACTTLMIRCKLAPATATPGGWVHEVVRIALSDVKVRVTDRRW